MKEYEAVRQKWIEEASTRSQSAELDGAEQTSVHEKAGDRRSTVRARIGVTK